MRQPCNKWTRRQRITLHLLNKLEYSARRQVEIFNAIYKADLEAHGILSGLSSRTLKIQYYERSRQSRQPRHPRQSGGWTGIGDEPATDEDRQTWQILTDEIRRFTPVPAEESPDDEQCPRVSAKTTQPSSEQGRSVADKHKDCSGQRISRRSSHEDLTMPKRKARRSSATRRQSSTAKKKVPLQRANDVIYVSPATKEAAEGPALVVTEEMVHLPQPGLLFRFWSEHSYGTNTENGFVAGRYVSVNSPVQPPPLHNEVDLADIELHLGKQPIATPYISTTNNLAWAIRNGAKEQAKIADEKGIHAGMMISVINAEVLQASGSLFWVTPYHRELKRQCVFGDGVWRYTGTHEFLVWHRIPQEAMISTFRLTDMEAAVQSIPSLARIMRLDLITRVQRGWRRTIVPELKGHQLELSHQAIHALAGFCCFLGLRPTSKSQHIEHVVSDVVRDWQIHIRKQTWDQWNRDASIFTAAMIEHVCELGLANTRAEKDTNDSSLSWAAQLQIRAAYLYGIRAALGDVNLLNPAKREDNLAKMHRRAETVNLARPDAIVRYGVQQILDPLAAYADEQTRRYCPTPRVTTRTPPAARSSASDESTVPRVVSLDEDEDLGFHHDDDPNNSPRAKRQKRDSDHRGSTPCPERPEKRRAVTPQSDSDYTESQTRRPRLQGHQRHGSKARRPEAPSRGGSALFGVSQQERTGISETITISETTLYDFTKWAAP